MHKDTPQVNERCSELLEETKKSLPNAILKQLLVSVQHRNLDMCTEYCLRLWDVFIFDDHLRVLCFWSVAFWDTVSMLIRLLSARSSTYNLVGRTPPAENEGPALTDEFILTMIESFLICFPHLDLACPICFVCVCSWIVVWPHFILFGMIRGKNWYVLRVSAAIMILGCWSSSFWDDVIVTGGKLAHLSCAVDWGFWQYLSGNLIKETCEYSSRAQSRLRLIFVVESPFVVLGGETIYFEVRSYNEIFTIVSLLFCLAVCKSA